MKGQEEVKCSSSLVAVVDNAVLETLAIHVEDSLVVLEDCVLPGTLPIDIAACRPGLSSNFLDLQLDRE